MAQIISVANSKGGVAKTVTTTHLGAALAHAGKCVLLIDVDQQHGLTSYFNAPLNGGTVEDALLDDMPLENCIVSVRENLDLAPATSRMGVAEQELPHRPGGDLRLRAALKPVKGNYDFILIDCPGNFGVVVRNSLLASSHMIIPINSEPPALKTARETERLARETAVWFDHEIVLLGALLTCFRTTRMAQVVAAGAAKTWPAATLSTRIRRAERINEMSAVGATLYDTPTARDSALREDFDALAAEVISRCQT